MASPEAAASRLESGWQEVYSALQWIHFTMAMLSVIGSSSIITYAIFQNVVRSPEVRPLFYLSLSDLFLGMCWIAGALLYSTPTSKHDLICYNLQAMGQFSSSGLIMSWQAPLMLLSTMASHRNVIMRDFHVSQRLLCLLLQDCPQPKVFYVASFLYTANYTWHLYMDLKMKYNQNLNRMPSTAVDYASCIGRVATILSSLIPFLLMVPVFCLGNSSNCYQNFSQKHGCLLMHTEMAEPTNEPLTLSSSVCRAMHFYGIGVFLVSFLISFIAILVVLIQARGLYKRFVNSTGFLGDQQWAMIKMVEQRVVFYPIAFFCCWAPAVLLGILKLTASTSSKIYMALLILQALTAASQGLLNCIVYGWTQHVFLSLKRNICRDVDTQTPLLRSQKKFYASTLTASPPDTEVSTSTLL
ncbi:transmembrane protein 116 isoform X1 [Tympanuchus pallidicinctus]|uniref:transmembrane protein 116 isoform X1 n=1 Tax=Tympanuchus pallidicinctus TaxID=109042 RepID=UPI0022870FA4|nr:transmembrane protein 116 isoform X1 [Tympanuchus pallidicinctus]